MADTPKTVKGASDVDLTEPAFEPDGFDVEAIAEKYQAKLAGEEVEDEALEDEEPTPTDPDEELARQSLSEEETDDEEGEPSGDEQPPAEEPPKEEEVSLKARQLNAIARREQEILQREQSLKEQEQRYANIEAQLRDSPAEVLKSLGLDPAAVAAQLYYAELGDDAPEDFKQKVKEQSQEARLKALEKRLEEERDQAKQAQEQAALRAQLQVLDHEFENFTLGLSKAEEAADTPHLHRFASEKPQAAYAALCEVAEADIRGGKWPSVSDVARRLEEGLVAELGIFQPKQSEKEASKKTSAAKQGTKRKKQKTLSDADRVGKKHRDLEEVQDDDFYIQRGIAVARKYGLT